MAITINNSKENENDQTVFFTIEYDSTDYKWHYDMPKILPFDEQKVLDSSSENIKIGILRQQYLAAEVPQLENKSALQSFEAWIVAGCKNAEVKGEDHEGNEYVITPEKVIEKRLWVDSH